MNPPVQTEAAGSILKPGSTGERVRELQQRLREIGFDPGEVDGIYGERTRRAVAQLQRDTDLTADGIVGAQTWDALHDAEEKRAARGATSKTAKKAARRKKPAESKPARTPDKIFPPELVLDNTFPPEFVGVLREAGYEFVPRPPIGEPPDTGIHDTGFDVLVRVSQDDIQRAARSKPAEPRTITGFSLRLPLYISDDHDWYKAGRMFQSWVEKAAEPQSLRALVTPTPDEVPEVHFHITGAGHTADLQGYRILRDLGASIAADWYDKLDFLRARSGESVDSPKEQEAESAQTNVDAGLTPSEILAGYAADDLERKDLLQIQNEVRALCSVIAARDVHPPLSIGLFGDWGVGKSFFMKEMQHTVEALTDRAQKWEENRGKEGYTTEPAFWSNVAQITFNAWHYMDANLWASLVARIFDGLAAHLDRNGRDRVAEERETLFREIELASREVRNLEMQRDAFTAQQRQAQAQLDEVIAQVAAEEHSLAALQPRRALDAAWRALRGNPALRPAIEALHLDAYAASADELRNQFALLQTDGGRMRQRLAALFSEDKLKWRGLVVLLVLVAGAGAGLALHYLSLPAVLGRWSAAAAQWLSWLGGIGGAVTVWLRKVNGHLRRVNELFTGFETEFGKQTDQLRSDRHQAAERVNRLKQNEQAKRKEVEAARAKVQVLQAQLEELKVGRRLFRFIEERVASADYRQHLGIIALVRRDFETLTDLLTENSRQKRRAWASPGTSADAPAAADRRAEVADIDRIVLYIDDLDRCPPARVVEVLQAVHLLLAFKLFVVVVAVDSRWLLRSLEKEYPDFLALDRKVAGDSTLGTNRWASTPQNYLEKIFQIPLTIKPMGRTGYTALLKELTAAQTRAVDGLPPDVAPHGEPGVIGPGTRFDISTENAPNVAVSTDDNAAAGESAQSTAHGAQVVDSTPPINLNPAQLELREHEVAFMNKLYGLLGTPRAVNRYVNTYRLIRATVAEDRLAAFIAKDGAYRDVMVLLGVLVGLPYEAAYVFLALDDDAAAGDWRTFVEGLRPVATSDSASKEIEPGAGRDGKVRAAATPVRYRNNCRERIQPQDVPRWESLYSVLSRIDEMQERPARALKPWVRSVARYAFVPIRFDRLPSDQEGSTAVQGEPPKAG